ncbi:hypothetical protein BKA69DRAFT_1068122 [Paraphysoderma sedebokerense]|nr:hypothetical protein BKA69DRAFT_1068122 [Paraphysoderma sedebokerense]
MDPETLLAVTVYLVVSVLPFLLAVYGIAYTIRTYKLNRTVYNLSLVISWICTTAYHLVFSISVFVEACHRKDTLKGNPLTYSSCSSSWLRVVMIVPYILGAIIFALCTVNFCSTVLRSAFGKWLTLQKVVFNVLQIFVIVAFSLYAVTWFIVFGTRHDSPDVISRFRINVLLFTASSSITVLACVIAAFFTFRHIVALKRELRSLKLSASQKSSRYITNIYRSFFLFIVGLGLHFVIVSVRLEFPFSGIRTSNMLLALASMTAFQLNSLALLVGDQSNNNRLSSLTLNVSQIIPSTPRKGSISSNITEPCSPSTPSALLKMDHLDKFGSDDSV